MYKRHLLLILLLSITINIMGFSVWAVPRIINYQGKLTNQNGVSLDGFYMMEFYLYNVESGGIHLWNEQQNVKIANGIYDVQLGKTSTFPSDLFDNENLYLEVKIFSTTIGWETLSPRQTLTSTPFAIKAGYASTAGNAETLGGLRVSDLFNTGDDYGRFGVAVNLYEGTTRLTNKYVNEGQVNSVTNNMIVNNAVTSNKIADGSVCASDISGNAVTSAKIQNGTIQQSDLSFNVPDGHSLDATDGSPVDAVYVDSSGNVGIGTNQPFWKFHVSGGPIVTSDLRLRPNIDGGNSGVWIGEDNMNHGFRFVYRGDLNKLRVWRYIGTAAVGPIIVIDQTNGNIGINRSDPGYDLHVHGDIAYSGNIYDDSDIRIKENITMIENPIEKISSIRGIYFNKKGEFPDNREVGVIAQEVELVLPEIVSEDDEGFKSVDYSKLTPLLIEAIKELKSENDYLKARITALEVALNP